MKKNLILLTGIVLLITILVAGGCQEPIKQNGGTILANDSTRVVYLKDTLIDGRMHLEMYHARDSLKKVIDSLYTVVQPGYTVYWKKAAKSKINAIHDIRLVDADSIFSLSKDSIGLLSLFKLEIPKDAKPDTIKYEIVFTVKQGGGTWCIDPYIRIED